MILLWLIALSQSQEWLRIGDERGIQGDLDGQETAYRRALEEDPALARDPSFRARLDKIYADRRQERPPTERRERGVRAQRILGAVLTFGPEDAVAVGPTLFLWQHLQLTVSLGCLTPSVSADARFVWFKSNFSPYIAGGIHVPFGRAWVATDWSDLWLATYLYGTIGVQYVADFGMYLHLGLSFVPSLEAVPGRFAWPMLMPTAAFGWIAGF